MRHQSLVRRLRERLLLGALICCQSWAFAAPTFVLETVANRLALVRLEAISPACAKVLDRLEQEYSAPRYRLGIFSYRSESSDATRARLEAAVPSFTYTWFVPWRSSDGFAYRYFMFSQVNDTVFAAFIEEGASQANVCLAIIEDS